MRATTKHIVSLMSLALVMAFMAIGARAQVAVITHKSTADDAISKSLLLDFYTGDIKEWSDGTPVIVMDLKEKGEVKDTFYTYLGKPSSRMKSIWMKNMLSGNGDPPKSVESEEDMIKKVSATPGAIGFVSRSQATKDVKTLLVIEEKTKK